MFSYVQPDVKYAFVMCLLSSSSPGQLDYFSECESLGLV